MTETTRTVPASDKFPGLTEIKRGDRTIACVGTGPRVEKAIRERLGR